jgi:diguanylate cyclase (GGDEF)-like protein
MLEAVGSDDRAPARPAVAIAVTPRDLVGHDSRADHPPSLDAPGTTPGPLHNHPDSADTVPGAGAGPGRAIGRRRTAALVAAAGLACLVTVALLSSSLGGSAITQQVNARLSSAGRQAAGYLEQVISGRVPALHAAADALPILALLEGSSTANPAATADLSALSTADPESQGVVLTDAAGSPVIRIGNEDPLTGLPTEWRASSARAGSLAVAAPSSLAAPAIDIAVPVLEGGGTVGGFLVERDGLGAIVTSTQSLAEAQGMTLLVLDRAGGLLFGVEPAATGNGGSMVNSWTAKAPVTADAKLALGNGSVGLLDDSGAGGPAAYSPVIGADWVVRATLPSSALDAVSVLRVVVFSICGVLAILFLAAVLMVNRALRSRERTEAALIIQSAAMEHAAMHDPLTGLPNRLLFNDRLQHGISYARRSVRPMALFVLDIDGFKALNDALGHSAGDAVLRETAARLQAAVRVSDTVARLGGDEFAIVAVDADPIQAELISTKIRQRMDEPMTIEDRQVPVGISIGVAAFPTDGAEPAHLLRRADTNMYREKRARKASAG